jgi:hypothetical protein
MIEPVYYQAWFEVIDQAKHQYGWPIPMHIEQYLSAVLANYVDKPNWEPQPSWAETLLSLQTARAAKVLGDQALFAAAIFPTMLVSKGINQDYFYNIGRMSYSQAESINYQLFNTLSRNFEFLAQCLHHSLQTAPRVQHSSISKSS